MTHRYILLDKSQVSPKSYIGNTQMYINVHRVRYV